MGHHRRSQVKPQENQAEKQDGVNGELNTAQVEWVAHVAQVGEGPDGAGHQQSDKSVARELEEQSHANQPEQELFNHGRGYPGRQGCQEGQRGGVQIGIRRVQGYPATKKPGGDQVENDDVASSQAAQHQPAPGGPSQLLPSVANTGQELVLPRPDALCQLTPTCPQDSDSHRSQPSREEDVHHLPGPEGSVFLGGVVPGFTDRKPVQCGQ